MLHVETDLYGLGPGWTEFKPYRTQQQVQTCDARFIYVPAGRGSGKTEIAKRRLVMALAEPKPWRDPRYFYMADTTSHAKSIAWDSFLDLIPADWIAGEPKLSLNCLSLQTVFGSSLHLMGAHRGTKRSLPIEGRQWDGGVMDESSDIPPGVFDRVIVPCLTWRKGWTWRIGVPKRYGIGGAEFRRMFEQAVAGTLADSAGFTWPSWDVVPPEFLVYAKNNMDPKDFREQYGASWETAGGGIFWAFDPQLNIRPCPYRPLACLSITCDFNVDPMCWVIGHRYADRLEVIDEIFLRDTNTRQTLDVLWSRYSDHHGGFEFFGDASGRARRSSASFSDYAAIAEDRRFTLAPGGRRVYIPEGNPRTADRFAATNAMVLNAAGVRRMFVSPSCTHLIDDLGSRHYKPGTSEPNDEGDLGHMTDALGYLIYRVWPIVIRLTHIVPTVCVSTPGPGGSGLGR